MEECPTETIMKTALDSQKRTVSSHGEINRSHSKYSHDVLGKKGGIDIDTYSVIVVREIKPGEAPETNCLYCGGKLMPKGSYCPFCGTKTEDRS